MPIQVEDGGVDVGIVTNAAEPMLVFYGEVLGLTQVGEMAMPGGMYMHRFQCGASQLKLVVQQREAPAAPAGGIAGGRGFRYVTLHVVDLEAAVAAAEQAGARVPVPITELAAGRRIAIVEDPDGNWVEFLQT